MMKAYINPTWMKGPFSSYMTPQETSILISLIRSANPKVMIEFGVNLGVTAMQVLNHVPTLEKYIGVDAPSGCVTTLACQTSEVPGERAGIYAADDKRFTLLTSRTQDLTKEHMEPCDAVFIDGDHSALAVLHESEMSKALCRPGGIIVWHDYGNPAVEVTMVLDRLYDQGWPIYSVNNSWLAFMRTGEQANVSAAA